MRTAAERHGQQVDIGRIGLWTFAFDLQSAQQTGETAAELEALGYGAVWLPEAAGRDPFVVATVLLGASAELRVATGIAGIYSRDAVAMGAAQRTLAGLFPDRFLLGLGVSHRPMVEDLRGHDYSRPVTYLDAYLDLLDAAPFFGAGPETPPPRVLAALGPRMLELAGERADGAHPYLQTPEHTHQARQILGDGKLLAPEQMVVLEQDPSAARDLARRAVKRYLGLGNYRRNLERLGFGEDDLADGGSDRLIDALVAWGDLDTIATRVREQFDAGADHVAVQVVTADRSTLPLAAWRRLAPALSQAAAG